MFGREPKIEQLEILVYSRWSGFSHNRPQQQLSHQQISRKSDFPPIAVAAPMAALQSRSELLNLLSMPMGMFRAKFIASPESNPELRWAAWDVATTIPAAMLDETAQRVRKCDPVWRCPEDIWSILSNGSKKRRPSAFQCYF